VESEKIQAGLAAVAGDSATFAGESLQSSITEFVIPAEPEFLNWSLTIRTQTVILC
jgi:hypothetical protein